MKMKTWTMNWSPAPQAVNLLPGYCPDGSQSVLRCSVDLEWREEDYSEEEQVEKLSNEGRHCNLGPKMTPCSKNITVDHYKSIYSQMSELTRDELDIVVLTADGEFF